MSWVLRFAKGHRALAVVLNQTKQVLSTNSKDPLGFTMSGRICNVEKNKAGCECSYPGCSRKGYCCDCLDYHWKHRELPGCLFPPEAEKTYNRSLEYFLEVWNEKMGKK